MLQFVKIYKMHSNLSEMIKFHQFVLAHSSPVSLVPMCTNNCLNRSPCCAPRSSYNGNKTWPRV